MRGYLIVDDLIEPISKATLNRIEKNREKAEIKRYYEENATMVTGKAQWESKNADPLRDIENALVKFRGY